MLGGIRGVEVSVDWGERKYFRIPPHRVPLSILPLFTSHAACHFCDVLPIFSSSLLPNLVRPSSCFPLLLFS